jgi:hypothetical protein
MGSLVVRCYLKKYDDQLDSLIVCGSPSENPAAGAGILLAKAACILGGKRPGKLFQNMAFAAYRKELQKDDPQCLDQL